MNSFNIALKMFRTNLKTYGFYLAVMIFAVAVYYDFTVLKYAPEFLKAKDVMADARIASSVTSFITVIFLFFFIWYSSSFFLKQRKKEIAVYSLMGVSTRKIGRIFAIECLFTGISTMIAGLAAGILFSRLFLMALAKVALLEVTVGFSIPVQGIKELLLIFGVIFLALSVHNFVVVARSKLIDLIRDSQKEEKEPKFKAVRAVLSILLIAAGYYFSKDITFGLLVAALVAAGTFWLFGALLPAVTKFLTDRKAILYKGVRLVSISNISFRIRGNYRSLAMLAVMTATTVTAFGTSLSLKYYVNETHHVEFPYSFSYALDDKSTHDRVVEAIHSSEHKLLADIRLEYAIAEAHIENGRYSDSGSYPVMKYSDFLGVTAEMEKQYSGETWPHKAISGKQALLVSPPALMGSIFSYEGRDLLLGTEKYVIMQEVKTPLFGKGALQYSGCIIVSDEEYEKLAKGQKAKVFHGFIVSDAKNSLELAKKLLGIVPEEAGLFIYALSYLSSLSFIGLFYFLGSFMSIVFILATGSIMYFKILSEALADKGKYDILRKIGMSRKEVRSAVSLQVGLSLILPLAVGIIHSLFAINALSGLLKYNLLVPTLAAIAIYALVYGVFYGATTRKFMKMVYSH